jgi:hypothetical protein
MSQNYHPELGNTKPVIKIALFSFGLRDPPHVLEPSRIHDIKGMLQYLA